MILARFKSQPFAVFAKQSVILDEFRFAQTEERGELCHFIAGEANFAGPAATGGASLALKLEFHVRR